MEDGSVVISILGDRKHIAKELEATRKDIEKTEKKLAEKVSEKSGIESKLEDAMNAAKATSEKIRALKREYRELGVVMGDKNTSAADYGRAASRQAAITRELQMQQPILKAQDADAPGAYGRDSALSFSSSNVTVSPPQKNRPMQPSALRRSASGYADPAGQPGQRIHKNQ